MPLLFFRYSSPSVAICKFCKLDFKSKLYKLQEFAGGTILLLEEDDVNESGSKVGSSTVRRGVLVCRIGIENRVSYSGR